jgi:hypothetical protein
VRFTEVKANVNPHKRLRASSFFTQRSAKAQVYPPDRMKAGNPAKQPNTLSSHILSIYMDRT